MVDLILLFLLMNILGIFKVVLKSKDYVLDVFKHLYANVKREIGKLLKCIRANNVGEYNGPFEHHWKDQNIKLDKTIPKTPYHNGVAEGVNAQLMIELNACSLM